VHLKVAAKTDGKAARNLVKIQLCGQFCVLVVCCIYFTRIVAYLLRSHTSYEYICRRDVAGELSTLSSYVLTTLRFRPHAENPYIATSLLMFSTDAVDILLLFVFSYIVNVLFVYAVRCLNHQYLFNIHHRA